MFFKIPARFELTNDRNIYMYCCYLYFNSSFKRKSAIMKTYYSSLKTTFVLPPSLKP